jgi:hypothetical protein
MNIIKYIFYMLLVADINQAYHLIPCIYNKKYRDIRTLGILRKKCGYIRNATEYALELLIIIDILLPKKMRTEPRSGLSSELRPGDSPSK